MTVHRVSSAAGDNGQDEKLDRDSVETEKKKWKEKITILYLCRYVS